MDVEGVFLASRVLDHPLLGGTQLRDEGDLGRVELLAVDVELVGIRFSLKTTFGVRSTRSVSSGETELSDVGQGTSARGSPVTSNVARRRSG